MANLELVFYIAVVLVSSVICFCGHWPIFEGTPIHALNYYCTGGVFELLEKCVGFTCGERGLRAIYCVEHYCCERPNPILQIFYFTIVGGAYFAAMTTSFKFIPGPYLSAIHWYLGTGSVVMGLLLFLLTSFSDPGFVSSSNVSDYLAMYPYDGVLYEEKTCSTCNIPRPPRSKHCSICGHCVARFDHHCGWTNTCIGENNLRYFMAFLFWHCYLCLYAAFVIAAVIVGEMKRKNLVRLLTVYYGIGSNFQELAPLIFQWVLAFHGEQLMLLLFLGIISLLLMGFSGYHLYLIIINTTTNETFKWENYKRLKAERVNTHEMPDDTSLSTADAAKKRSKHSCSIPFFTRRNSQNNLQRENIYDRGILQNLAEVFFPRSSRLWWQDLRLFKVKYS